MLETKRETERRREETTQASDGKRVNIRKDWFLARLWLTDLRMNLESHLLT